MTTVDLPARPDVAEPDRHRFDWRRPVRVFGFACLMGAAGLSGYVGWLLWGTGLETTRAQDALRPEFVKVIATKEPAQAPSREPLPGTAYAEIVIPSIDIDFIVVQGTDYTSLRKGPGHYSDTADPWDETGRVGIAGHRTTYLHPFFNLDDVGVGDPIVLRTEYGIFRYQVTRNFVLPETGSGVVLEQTQKPTLVLTTCNPKYASSQRLIVTAALISAPPG